MVASGTQGPDAVELWSPYLQNGEKLLWTGRPSAKLALSLDARIGGLIGGFVSMIIGALIITGQLNTISGKSHAIPEWFGWLFFAIGAANAFAPLLWSSWQRWTSRYAVTDHRALALGRSIGVRTLQSWRIERLPMIELSTGWHKSVWFERTGGGIFSRSLSRNIGFELIPDAEDVHQLLLKIQSEAK